MRTRTPLAAPELKFTPLDFKAVAADGAFEGYASLFDKEDLGHDIISPGAFRDSLARRGPAAIKMLFQHNPSEPIGVWDIVREDARGLWVRGRLMREVARAREVLALMRAGALDGLSIGFRAIKGRRDPKTGIRRLARVDLWEISVVTFPLLPEARVTNVKSHDRQRLAAAIAAAILATPATMIHAMEGAPVCEVSLSPWWRRRLAGAFRFPLSPPAGRGSG
jgi:HK97 family phage prohead protease